MAKVQRSKCTAINSVYCLQVLQIVNSPWTVTFLVAFTVDGGVLVVDWQVYCLPWDVTRGLNERVRMVVFEPVVL